jgi:hypothetical protein
MRIRAIQTSCPYALYFIGHIQGTLTQEREIHKTFDHLRLQGEWFKSDLALLAYIHGVCAIAPGPSDVLFSGAAPVLAPSRGAQ